MSVLYTTMPHRMVDDPAWLRFLINQRLLTFTYSFTELARKMTAACISMNEAIQNLGRAFSLLSASLKESDLHDS